MKLPSIEGRAIRRYHKDRVIELCPHGHYMRQVVDFTLKAAGGGSAFGGSAAAVELGQQPRMVFCDGDRCEYLQ